MFVRNGIVRREVRSYDLGRFSPDALVENFKRGSYKLPRTVRRFLHRPLEAYAGRPRMIQAVVALATIIGRFHTGEQNFVARGCGIGADEAGFFLARKGLCGPNGFQGLTEALVREATAFLITIGFIERVSPKGEMIEVRRPKNALGEFGYFRLTQRARKDALGRIRSPLTIYRLASRTRRLFAKTLRPGQTQNAAAVQEPLWRQPPNRFSMTIVTGCEGNHSGSSTLRFSESERMQAEAALESIKPRPLTLSPAARAIFHRPVR